MRDTPRVSVVVPLLDEAPNVRALASWIVQALSGEDRPFEVVLVDDGSSDETWPEILAAARQIPEVRGIRLARNVGQTAAMMAGFDHARGDVVVSLDGDLQNDPRDIPLLMSKLREGYDLVCGWRQERQDALFLRLIPSLCANRLIAWLTGVPIKDNGCSLKAYRHELLDRLTLYAEQHRFIPALAASSGARIAQIPVRHHARRHGKSKYGISRTFKVLIDLLTLKMVTTFRSRPLVGFGVGMLGAIAIGLSFTGSWLVAFTTFGPDKANSLVLPGAAVLWFGVALYLLMLGLIAEVALKADEQSTQRTPVVREVRH